MAGLLKYPGHTANTMPLLSFGSSNPCGAGQKAAPPSPLSGAETDRQKHVRPAGRRIKQRYLPQQKLPDCTPRRQAGKPRVHQHGGHEDACTAPQADGLAYPAKARTAISKARRACNRTCLQQDGGLPGGGAMAPHKALRRERSRVRPPSGSPACMARALSGRTAGPSAAIFGESPEARPEPDIKISRRMPGTSCCLST